MTRKGTEMHLVAGVRSGNTVCEGVSRHGWLFRAAEWLADLAGGAWIGGTAAKASRLKVIETVALGGKKQLVLVRCDGESYLVGTGPESVQTIVRVERRNIPAGPTNVVPVHGEVY